jgi:O-antigen ligase
MGRARAETVSVGFTGWALCGVFVLTPLAAWLGPLAYAPIAALGGLLTLPRLRIDEQGRPVALLLLALVAWAGLSVLWSPYRPADPDAWTGLKLALQLPLCWALFCAASSASPAATRRLLQILAWGAAALGVLITVESLTHAALYRAMRVAIGDPIRMDFAEVKIAQAAFVLTLLTPVAAVAAVRVTRAPWLVLPMIAAILVSHRVMADAPPLALLLALVAGAAALRWPMGAPLVLAGLASAFFLLAPLAVWLAMQAGLYAPVEAGVPLSWSMRMGYWRHAVGWIVDHPLRGWGLDASRMFAPGIGLHPHDSALQIWLELGLPGAVLAALFWALVLTRMAREKADLPTAACLGSAVVYLTFGAISFGVWQEWWLGLGAIAAVAGAALQRQPRLAVAKAGQAGAAPPTSTLAPVSE